MQRSSTPSIRTVEPADDLDRQHPHQRPPARAGERRGPPPPGGSALPTTGDGWLVAALCLAALVGFLLAIALSPFLPDIAADLGTSVALLGQIPALTMLVAAALGLVAGPLADIYGPRRLLVAGTLAVLVSALATAASFSFAALALAALCGAISRAIVQPVALAVAGGAFAGAAQQRAVSWVVAAVAGAPIVGVPLLTAIAGVASWRAAFLALGVLAVVATALVLGVLPPDRANPAEQLRPGPLLGAYAPLVQHPPTLGLVGSSLLRNVSVWMFFTYYGAYLVERRGLSVQAAGLAYTGVGVGFFIGSMAAGGRLGVYLRRPVLMGATLLLGLLVAGPVLLAARPLALVAVLSVGAAVAGVTGVGVTLLLTSDSPAGRATTMTLNQAAMSVGTALGSAVGGLLLAVGGYEVIAIGVAVFAGAAALLTRGARPVHPPVPAAAPVVPSPPE